MKRIKILILLLLILIISAIICYECCDQQDPEGCEQLEMHGFVSSLEQVYSASINREERMLYILFNFTTNWKTYEKVIGFIQQKCKGRPYLTIL
ncbi:hypothetical protein J2X31_000126 [Flavobacterium arsenatis]|uniref:Uncharacterized protein n=1 Tax=Flavobacterium arsenatis TaxID=1484332 RepID=A0ABU1TJH6_9FLAO|nr:hypothetical protein [Flavobacterium arsenatis]MDR6966133.1 hypothetical protein [Flavobacterium arsenatis]